MKTKLTIKNKRQDKMLDRKGQNKLFIYSRIESIRRNFNNEPLCNQLLVAMYDQIKSDGPYDYFLTLTYPCNLDDYDSKRMLKFFLTRLSRKIYGKRRMKGTLEGYKVKEKQYKSTGHTHYHLLLKHNELFYQDGKPSIEDHVANLIMTFTYTTRLDQKISFKSDYCDNKKIYNVETLISYMLKDYKYNHDFDFVTPLDEGPTY